MDSDCPWEENPRTDHIPEAEWIKITAEFTNSGYREGIVAGKEAFLQPGFDDGFASIGVPLGRELGNLRGVATAIRSFLFFSQSPDALALDEIRSISSVLSTIRFSDIAPRDLEAGQHAEEHTRLDDLVIPATVDSGKVIEDVARLKERLALLSAKLGLNAIS